ncbi:MAG: transcriptional regulator NrdR [Thermaerobacter sp.]|nr:transcriptional regulator NrdR [Bacillota bacterium]
MRCPFCRFDESRVLDSRPVEDGSVIRRRRECERCGERFTTYERVELTPLLVIKKDGRREPFDRQKILAGLITACEKRPVSLERLEQLAAQVERELRGRPEREVESKEIGDLVMERLRHIDEIAYVRFASVYLEFPDLRRFREEVDRLMRQRAGRLEPQSERWGEDRV